MKHIGFLALALIASPVLAQTPPPAPPPPDPARELAQLRQQFGALQNQVYGLIEVLITANRDRKSIEAQAVQSQAQVDQMTLEIADLSKKLADERAKNAPKADPAKPAPASPPD